MMAPLYRRGCIVRLPSGMDPMMSVAIIDDALPRDMLDLSTQRLGARDMVRVIDRESVTNLPKIYPGGLIPTIPWDEMMRNSGVSVGDGSS